MRAVVLVFAFGLLLSALASAGATNPTDPICDFNAVAQVGVKSSGRLSMNPAICDGGSGNDVIAFYSISPELSIDVTGRWSFTASAVGPVVLAFYAQCVVSQLEVCSVGTISFQVSAAPPTTTVVPTTQVPPTTAVPTTQVPPTTTTPQPTAAPTTLQPPTPLPQPPQVVVTNAPTRPPPASAAISCQGVCNGGAWTSSQDTPDLWDVSPLAPGSPATVYTRADGRRPDQLTFAQRDGSLVVTAYGDIGNMAARFPTLELVQYPAGRPFSSLTLNGPASSYGFDPSCLDRQPPTGLGDEVWTWINKTALQGQMNALATAGFSFYQKFGGKHDQCNTYVQDPCRYAPLLSPRQSVDASQPQWKVDVSYCDTTWTGTFSPAAVLFTRLSDGTPAFKRTTDSRVLTATFYNQAVKPASWILPTEGILSNYSQSTVYLRFLSDPRVDISEIPPPQVAAVAGSAGSTNGTAPTTPTSPVTVDVRANVYAGPSQEQHYWYSFAVYGLDQTDAGQAIADVSVTDFAFTVPRCDRCGGNTSECSLFAMLSNVPVNATPGKAACVGSKFGFRFGPQATTECAPANASFSTLGVVGVSDAIDAYGGTCPAFRNVTIDFFTNSPGTAAELGQIPRSFGLVLTLVNGRRFQVTVRDSPYVSQVATTPDGFAKFTVCRGNPNVNTTAIDAFNAGATDATVDASNICIRTDKTFAPTEQVFLSLDIPSPASQSSAGSSSSGSAAAAGNFSIYSLTLTFLRAKRTGPYLYYLVTPPTIDPSAPISDGVVYNWQRDAGFLNFHVVPGALFAGQSALRGSDIGFLFTPGTALQLDDPQVVEVVVECSYLTALSTQPITVTERIVVDQSLADRGSGMPPVVTGPPPQSKASLALAAAIVILGVVALVFDPSLREKLGGIFGHSHEHGHGHSHGNSHSKDHGHSHSSPTHHYHGHDHGTNPGKPDTHSHDHDHDHDHDHGHDHGHDDHGHDHDHGHGSAAPEELQQLQNVINWAQPAAASSQPESQPAAATQAAPVEEESPRKGDSTDSFVTVSPPHSPSTSQPAPAAEDSTQSAVESTAAVEPESNKGKGKKGGKKGGSK